MRIVTALVSLAFALAPAAALAQVLFQAQIDIAQEQAAGNCPAGSTARGIGTMTLNPDNTLSYSIQFGNNPNKFDNGMLDNGAESAAHFHIGAPGVSGGIVTGIGLGSPKIGSTPVLNASQVTSLKAGDFYVNIHSSGCGQGEIRGQVLAIQNAVPLLSPAALLGLATLLGGAGALATRRLRATA